MHKIGVKMFHKRLNMKYLGCKKFGGRLFKWC